MPSRPHDSTAENIAETAPLGTEETLPVFIAAPYAEPEAYTVPRSAVENVLLIDGDNDPHVPPDARVTRSTLVRVFLRPGALLPRNLEKPLSHLPNFCTVTSPKGGANAADFVMSLHAGMLHAILPSSVPFLMVTNDATLSAMAAELQRLGRIAAIWTSHPDAETMSAEATGRYESAGAKPARRNRGRSGRSRAALSPSPRRASSARGRAAARVALPPVALPPVAPLPAPVSDAPRKTGGKTLSEVSWTYASRLLRIKDVPARVKTLLNDIKNRAGSHGFSPEEILEELKRHHGVKVNASGRVQVEKVEFDSTKDARTDTA